MKKETKIGDTFEFEGNIFRVEKQKKKSLNETSLCSECYFDTQNDCPYSVKTCFDVCREDKTNVAFVKVGPQQMFINDKCTTMFFDGNMTLEKIYLWVIKNMSNDTNIFNLNKSYLCEVSILEDRICIWGGEDLVYLTLEEISIIK